MAQVNITEIRDFLYTLMYRKVSLNVYYDTLPNTDSDSIDNMVLLDLKGSNVNNGAMGTTSVRVYLLAVDYDNGNILADLEEKFNMVIKHYMESKDATDIEVYHRNSFSGHDTDKRLRYYVKELVLKIK